MPRNEITVEIGKNLGLPLIIGIPGYELFMDIRNGGNRTVNISGMRMEVTHPNGTIKRLEAHSYYRMFPGRYGPQVFPVTRINLDPGLSWAEMVSFYRTYTPSEDEEISRLRLLMEQSIVSKVAKVEANNPHRERRWPTEADPALVTDARNFFDRKFDLEKGVYKGRIIAKSDDKEQTITNFWFTLYDFHINKLKWQREELKFGEGVYFSVRSNPQVWVLVSKAE